MDEKWGSGVAKSTAKRVLITGGTGSVGESLVKGFSGRGYRVTFLYHTAEARAEALARNYNAVPLRQDLSRPFEVVNKEVDILINNAAINEGSELSGDVPLEGWNRTLCLNLTAPFLLIQQCLPYMISRQWGRIVNISSIYGLRAGESYLPYTVSKHGLSGLTKTVAREYAGHGITCNEICPGPIDSRLLARICSESARRGGVSVEEYMREIKEELPTGELVGPAVVTHMTLLLASEECGAINGSSMVIDGGMIV